VTSVHKRKSLKKRPPLAQGHTLVEPLQVIGDQADVEPGKFALPRCDCGAVLQAGVDHSCPPKRRPKTLPWEIPAAKRR